jgi:hypothetical protein
LLSRYRFDPAVTRLRASAVARRRRWLAIAAALIVIVGASLFAYVHRFRWGSDASWDILNVNGSATLDGRAIDARSRLAVGKELRTGAGSHVIARIARVGTVEIGSDSRVILVDTGERHRMRLERGTLSARLWAPPFTFAVRTPAGLASDIGCAFTLRYDEGAGEVRVTSGWVDFDGDTRSSLIPAGAIAELRDAIGPGTPFYDDASPAFRAALRAFDFQGDHAALPRVIAAARPRDAMTLLHLLQHSRPEDRGMLFDALSALASPPAGVTRAGVLKRDLRMLDAWRRSLGLSGVKQWWVNWRDAL